MGQQREIDKRTGLKGRTRAFMYPVSESSFYGDRVMFNDTGSIRLDFGKMELIDGMIGVSYGTSSTSTSANTINFNSLSSTQSFSYPDIPVQDFGTEIQQLENKSITFTNLGLFTPTTNPFTFTETENKVYNFQVSDGTDTADATLTVDVQSLPNLPR